jgi:DNA helicase-2/ATP-dependent DNA helicase PcrA
MTRAKKRLFITWNQGYSYMLETYKTPSRFLNEIPDETIHMEKKKEQPVTTMRKPSSAKYRKGDLVIHSQFGQGVIIDVQGTVATIAFERKYGVKKLNALHPSLKKLVS